MFARVVVPLTFVTRAFFATERVNVLATAMAVNAAPASAVRAANTRHVRLRMRRKFGETA
jgi:hypothetical protein